MTPGRDWLGDTAGSCLLTWREPPPELLPARYPAGTVVVHSEAAAGHGMTENDNG